MIHLEVFHPTPGYQAGSHTSHGGRTSFPLRPIRAAMVPGSIPATANVGTVKASTATPGAFENQSPVQQNYPAHTTTGYSRPLFVAPQQAKPYPPIIVRKFS